MLSQAQKKFLTSLKQKKYRKEHGVFVSEGLKIVRELLQSELEVTGVYGTSEGIDSLQDVLDRAKTVFTISASDLERISNLKTPNQVFAVAKQPQQVCTPHSTDSKLTLALDSIQDPGNLGTIIRTADWFGIRNVLCSHSTADIFSPKVVQASMGSFLRVNVVYTNLADYFSKFYLHTHIFGTFPEGNSIFSEAIPENAFLVIGNESVGISPDLVPFIRRRLTIPGSSHLRSVTGAESLNASVAAGIIMAWATQSDSR